MYRQMKRYTEGEVWKGPEPRSFLPVELGCTTIWHMGVLDLRAL